MPKHLNDGQLRAALDGELGPDESRHLESCPACLERKRQMHARSQATAAALTFLSPTSSTSDNSDLDARAALARLRHRALLQKENSMFKKMFASPALRYGAAAVLLLALLFSFPATRALADQLLNLFRVQQVTVVRVDYTGMQQLTGQGPIGQQVSALLSDSITMTHKPGKPTQATDAAQASQLAGFNVRLPQNDTPSRISVTDSAAFTLRIDRTKAQALLDEAGRSDLVLPESVDGQDVSVSIPSGVSAAYGTCPEPRGEDGTADPEEGPGLPGRRYADCILFAQIPSPTVSAPADLDVAQLARIGLQFAGMDSDQAAAFTDSVDWTSTLVIPIPKNAATYEQLQIDGVTGTLIQRPADDAPQFSLIWVKDGIIYAIGGLGSNSDKAIQMANSLP